MASEPTPMLHDPKPMLFIGSSTEGLEPARAIRNLLDTDVQCWLWNEAFFQFGLGFLESLVVRLKTFDFAVLVATPDDETTSKNVSSLSPRDNVIFELGLFIGHLGRERVFLVHPARQQIKIPSDLAGVTTAQYDWPYSKSEEQQLPNCFSLYLRALGRVCDQIRAHIKNQGLHESKINQKMAAVQREVDAASLKIAELFALSMSSDGYHQLCKLEKGWDGHYFLDPDLHAGLAQELRHLKMLGYIEFDKDPKVKGVGNLPTGNQNNLSRFISVTDTGRRFIELREEALKQLGR
jgi:predicted nucleotide-binding protein